MMGWHLRVMRHGGGDDEDLHPEVILCDGCVLGCAGDLDTGS